MLHYACFRIAKTHSLVKYNFDLSISIEFPAEIAYDIYADIICFQINF